MKIKWYSQKSEVRDLKRPRTVPTICYIPPKRPFTRPSCTWPPAFWIRSLSWMMCTRIRLYHAKSPLSRDQRMWISQKESAGQGAALTRIGEWSFERGTALIDVLPSSWFFARPRTALESPTFATQQTWPGRNDDNMNGMAHVKFIATTEGRWTN